MKAISFREKVSAIKPWNHIQNAFERPETETETYNRKNTSNGDSNILVLIKEQPKKKKINKKKKKKQKKCTRNIF